MVQGQDTCPGTYSGGRYVFFIFCACFRVRLDASWAEWMLGSLVTGLSGAGCQQLGLNLDSVVESHCLKQSSESFTPKQWTVNT